MSHNTNTMAQIVLLGSHWRQCFLHMYGPKSAPGPPPCGGHHLDQNSCSTLAGLDWLAFQLTCCGTALNIEAEATSKSPFISLTQPPTAGTHTQANKINPSNTHAFFSSKCIDSGRLEWDGLLTFPMVIVWGFLFDLGRDHAKNVSGWGRV